MPTHCKLLLSAIAIATVLGSASAVSGKCSNNTYSNSAANLSKSIRYYSHGGSGHHWKYWSYAFDCQESQTGFRLKDNAPDIDAPTGDVAAMKAACCNGPTCTGNNQYWRWDFECGAGKHSKPNGNTIALSGADTAAKQAVCCDDDVAGMCSGNRHADVNNGLDMPSNNITPSPSASPTPAMSPSASPVFTGTYQLRCDSHTQLKPTSDTITVSGTTAAEKQTMCCDPTTPTNAAFFDKCSTITTRPHTTTTGGIEYDLAPASTFCGVGKEYDAAKAESTCAAGQCNQNTAADVTTCCKTSAPCANTDGTSANTVQCQCGNALWKCGAGWVANTGSIQNAADMKEGLFCNAARNMCGVTTSVNSFSLPADAVPTTAPRTFAKCSATTGTTVVMDVNECYEFSMAKGAGFDFTEIRSKDHPSGCFLQGGDRTKFSRNLGNGKESARVQVFFNSVSEQFAAPEVQFEMVCKAGTVCASTDGNATNVVSCVCGEKECESGSTCTSSESKCTLVNQAEKVVALEAEVVALRIKVVELEAKDTALEAKDTALEAKDTALEAKDTALEAKDTALEAKDTALETKAVALAKQYDGIDKMCKGDDKGGDERRLDSAAVGCGGASDAEFTYLSGSSHTEQALLVGAMVIAATIINI